MRRLRLKTRIFASAVVVANVTGNFLLSLGLRHHGPESASSWLQVLASPWFVLGVSFLAVWMLCRLALLSWADLSWVVPVTATGYVLNALAGKFFLGEHISLTRWAGILIITLGVLMVRSTAIRTTRPRRPREASR
ncbi:MAG: EamA family transporter [Bryobacteraceae bacterium]